MIEPVVVTAHVVPPNSLLGEVVEMELYSPGGAGYGPQHAMW